MSIKQCAHKPAHQHEHNLVQTLYYLRISQCNTS